MQDQRSTFRTEDKAWNVSPYRGKGKGSRRSQQGRKGAASQEGGKWSRTGISEAAGDGSRRKETVHSVADRLMRWRQVTDL